MKVSLNFYYLFPLCTSYYRFLFQINLEVSHCKTWTVVVKRLESGGINLVSIDRSFFPMFYTVLVMIKDKLVGTFMYILFKCSGRSKEGVQNHPPFFEHFVICNSVSLCLKCKFDCVHLILSVFKSSSSIDLEGEMVDNAIDNVISLPCAFSEVVECQKDQSNEIQRQQEMLNTLKVNLLPCSCKTFYILMSK